MKGLNSQSLAFDATVKEKLQAQICEEEYYEFFKVAYEILLPDEPFNDNWHIKYICDILDAEVRRIAQNKPKDKDIIINVPFRSTKSLICTVCLPPWAWLVKPSMKFVYVSFSESLALDHANLSRTLIRSEWYQRYFGDKVKLSSSQNSLSYFANTGGGFRKSVGTGGQITGSGGDIVAWDDPQDPQRARSEAERKNTISFHDNTLYSRLNQPKIGLRLGIQQRLHEEDLTGHLLEQNPDNYHYVKIPAELSEKNKPIPEELEKEYKNGLFFPDRWPQNLLDDVRKQLGSYQYESQMNQNPQPAEGEIMKREWFDIVTPEHVQWDPDENPVKFYLDTAETEKQEGDFSAIVACFKRDNFLYIVDVTETKREFYELVKFIKQYVKKFRYNMGSSIKIEPKSSGKSIVSQLRNTTDLNVAEIKLKEQGRPETSKIVRVNAIQPICESRRIVLVKGPWNDHFLDQLTTFPNAKHDDMVDAFTHAVTEELSRPGFGGITWI